LNAEGEVEDVNALALAVVAAAMTDVEAVEAEVARKAVRAIGIALNAAL